MTARPITTEDLRQTGAVKIEQAAAYLGVSRTIAYEAARTGQWPVVHVGKRRVLVPSGWLLRVAGHDAEPAA